MAEEAPEKKTEPWPTQLRLTDEGKLLTIAFDSGDPSHTVLTVVPKNSCGIALFGPH